MDEFVKYVFYQIGSCVPKILVIWIMLFAILYCITIQKATCIPLRNQLLYYLTAAYLTVVSTAVFGHGNGYIYSTNFHLFRMWREAWNSFGMQEWLNVILNILLFLPGGILLQHYLSKKFRKWYICIFAAIGISLSIEGLQYLFGRGVFDVDDLFCNSLGMMQGFVLYMSVFTGAVQKRKYASLLYCSLFFIPFLVLVAMFGRYQNQKYGNLSDAMSFRVNTDKIEWKLLCDISEEKLDTPIYLVDSYSLTECKEWGMSFGDRIGATFDDIQFYGNTVWLTDHGHNHSAHFLIVNSPARTFSCTSIWTEQTKPGTIDDQELKWLLESYDIKIPEQAGFWDEGDGWYSFTAHYLKEENRIYEGILRCKYTESGHIVEIENNICCMSYVCEEQIISETEALRRLQLGYFNDSDIQVDGQVCGIKILEINLTFCIDTKGFLQPCYRFILEKSNGMVFSILIPAIE